MPGTSLANMAELIPEMRRVKDDQEIEKIQKAINITGSGILAAMKAVEPGQMEFQLQSVVEHAYEMEGAQFLGFSTILAWGPNTTVLHYGGNNQRIQGSGLVLIDTGAAWEHYSADVTRTIPVSGTFSAREKELYELVLKASNAAIEQVKPGADYYELPLRAGVVITVEPGIYIPEEGIGIRIEDDVLVTKRDPVVLSGHIPRTVEDIEHTMAD